MLNETCKLGLQEILSTIDDNNLFSLATTVTQGLLKNRINSRQEAANVILNYSKDVESILRRKVITREILLLYLHNKNISLDLPATKSDLINKIIDSWSIQSQEEFFEINYNAIDSESVALLAEKFCQWFYAILNKNECMNDQHFYPDAKLKMNIITNGQLTSRFVENNPQEIVQQLFLERMKYNLYFNPNLSRQGVQGQIDPHGLVMVLTCGTLHVNNSCVGIFEQMFTLVRDPLCENNWKIKSTEVNLKSQSEVVSLPTLEKNVLLLPLK